MNYQVKFSHETTSSLKEANGQTAQDQTAILSTIFCKTVSSFLIAGTKVRQGDVSWTANGYLT